MVLRDVFGIEAFLLLLLRFTNILYYQERTKCGSRLVCDYVAWFRFTGLVGFGGVFQPALPVPVYLGMFGSYCRPHQTNAYVSGSRLLL